MEQEQKKKKRPTFLVILCILSFIGGGLELFEGIYTLVTRRGGGYSFQESIERINQAREEIPGQYEYLLDDLIRFMYKAAEHALEMGISGIVLALFSLFGVWKMFNLKKKGYYIYVVAQVLMLLTPFFFLGVNLITFTSMIFAGIITLAFVIMYGVNLKHME